MELIENKHLQSELQNQSVLYFCHCGEKHSLMALYWSDPCEKLVCDSPVCSLVEIDSYYCPYMFENMRNQEALLYRNRSSNTFLCPDCECTLNTTRNEDKFFFTCPYCRWDSKNDIGIFEDKPENLIMTLLSREREANHNETYEILVSYYSKKCKAGKKFKNVNKMINENQLSWKWTDVENHLKTKKEENIRATGNDSALQDSLKEPYKLKKGSLYKRSRFKKPNDFIENLNKSPIATLQQRNQNPMDSIENSRDIYPCRLLLRTKNSRRCVDALRKDLPGILVKPQINPMTGDSSMHTTASWWKKATLAITSLPVVLISSFPRQTKNTNEIECSFIIINPLDNPIDVSLRHTDTSQSTIQPDIDNSPIRIGAAEDPNLADPSSSHSASLDEATNRMIQEKKANIVSIRIITRSPETPDSHVSLRLSVDSTQYDLNDPKTIHFDVELNFGKILAY